MSRKKCEHLIVLFGSTVGGGRGVCAECRQIIIVDIRKEYMPVFAAVKLSKEELDEVRRRIKEKES